MRRGQLFVEVDADFIVELDPWPFAMCARCTDLILFDYIRMLALGHIERAGDWLVEDTRQSCEAAGRVVSDMMLDQRGSFQVDEAKRRQLCQSLL
jgi:hypothetical protein